MRRFGASFCRVPKPNGVNGVIMERTETEGKIMDEDSRTVKVFQAVQAITHAL